MNDNQEEYLTVKELSSRIKFSRQTIYNMISARKLVRGRHYIKPSRKKILFMWSNVRAWLEDGNKISAKQGTMPGDDKPSRSRICI